MASQFRRVFISACVAIVMTGPACAQDSFCGYSPTFRSFWTGHAVKELTSAHPNALVEKAEANLSAGKFNEAVSNFKEFLATNSDRQQKIVYSLDLADALQRAGNTYAATAVCDEVTNDLFAMPDSQTNEETLGFLNSLGTFYRHAGETEKAKRCFIEVLELCEKQTTTPRIQKSVCVQMAQQELLCVYLQEKDFKSALPLAKQFPPEIKVHATGFDISIGRGSRGEGFATFLPKGRKGSDPAGLDGYQRGVRYLNRRSLADAEREFLQSAGSRSDASIRRASLVALSETYRQWGKARKSLNSLSEYLVFASESF